MKTSIQLYNVLEQIVQRLYTHLKLEQQENTKGRKLALTIVQTISLAVFKQFNGIPPPRNPSSIFSVRSAPTKLWSSILIVLPSKLCFSLRSS